VEVLKSVLTGPIPQTRTSTSTLDIVDLRDIVSIVQVQKKKFGGLRKSGIEYFLATNKTAGAVSKLTSGRNSQLCNQAQADRVQKV